MSVFSRGSGGGTSDAVARTTANAAKNKVDLIMPDAGTVVKKGSTAYFNIGGVLTGYEAKTADSTVPATVNDANLTSAGFTKATGGAVTDTNQRIFTIIRSTADLTKPTTAEITAENGGTAYSLVKLDKARVVNNAGSAVWFTYGTSDWDAGKAEPAAAAAVTTFNIQRTDNTSTAPTAVEIASPADTNIAEIVTANGSYYKYERVSGAWVLRLSQPIAVAGVDAGEVWTAGRAYALDETSTVRIPATGTFVDIKGKTLTNNMVYTVVYPTAQTAGAAFDVAEALKVEAVLAPATSQAAGLLPFDTTKVYAANEMCLSQGMVWMTTLGAAASTTTPLNALGVAANQWRWMSGNYTAAAVPTANRYGPENVNDLLTGKEYVLENLGTGGGGSPVYAYTETAQSSSSAVAADITAWMADNFWVTVNTTFNVPGDYATLNDFETWLRPRRIQNGISVTVNVAAGTHTIATALQGHPDGSAVRIVGAALLGAFPVQADFTVTGTTAGARNSDYTANVAVLNARFATILNAPGGVTVNVSNRQCYAFENILFRGSLSISSSSNGRILTNCAIDGAATNAHIAANSSQFATSNLSIVGRAGNNEIVRQNAIITHQGIQNRLGAGVSNISVDTESVVQIIGTSAKYFAGSASQNVSVRGDSSVMLGGGTIDFDRAATANVLIDGESSLQYGFEASSTVNMRNSARGVSMANASSMFRTLAVTALNMDNHTVAAFDAGPSCRLTLGADPVNISNTPLAFTTDSGEIFVPNTVAFTGVTTHATADGHGRIDINGSTAFTVTTPAVGASGPGGALIHQ